MNKEEILRRLGEHRPVSNEQAAVSLTLHWMSVVLIIAMAPLAVFLIATAGRELAFDGRLVASCLLGVGLVGIYIAYLFLRHKDRRNAAEYTWRLSKLSSDDCEELVEISAIDPKISDIVDHWAETWANSNWSPRRRDLDFLREMVAAWKDADATDSIVSPVARPDSAEGDRPAS